jgi:nucleotide-binding universal stress UspA family protein
MSKTREKRREQHTSPTSMAPVVVGFDGYDGGRDALELARVLGAIRESRCIVATPRKDGLAEEARAALDDPEAEICVIGALSPAQTLIRLAEREHAGTLVAGASRADRRADRLERVIIRTVAEHLLRHSPCEVVAAPRGCACGPDVDLLVTGSRRPIEHFLAGSVTQHLVNDSSCPVLVVPHSRKA